jgi:hypothetical protein
MPIYPKQIGRKREFTNFTIAGVNSITLLGAVEQYRVLTFNQTTAGVSVDITSPFDTTTIFTLTLVNRGTADMVIVNNTTAFSTPLKAGTSISVTWDGAEYRTRSLHVASATENGLMSTADKVKLDNQWTVKHKTVAQPVTNSAALVDDTDLQFPITAAGTYTFRIYVAFSSAVNNANLRFRHTCSGAGLSGIRITRRHIVPGGVAYAGIITEVAFSAADVTVVGASVNPGFIWIDGTFTTTGTTGSFIFRWAQNIARVTPTNVQPGSYIEYKKIA